MTCSDFDSNFYVTCIKIPFSWILKFVDSHLEHTKKLNLRKYYLKTISGMIFVGHIVIEM